MSIQSSKRTVLGCSFSKKSMTKQRIKYNPQKMLLKKEKLCYSVYEANSVFD